MKKRLLIISTFLLIFITVSYPAGILAQEMQDENTVVQQELEEEAQEQQEDALMMTTLSTTYYTKTAKSDGTFTTIKSYSSFSDALAAMKASNDANTVVTSSAQPYNGGVVAMKEGIAVSIPEKTTMNIYITGTDTAYTYIPLGYDLYYYSTTSSTRAKIGISGYVGAAKLTELMLIPRIQVKGQSYYSVASSGSVIHYLARFSSASRTPSKYENYTLTKSISFMTAGVHYYSMDGSKFYTDPQLTCLAGTYHNYFDLLPIRSKTNYTVSEINSYIASLNKSISVLNGQGQAFVDAQNKYGVNALLLLCIAFHESAYGTSNYAVNRYNLFGINAGDANPDDASYYSSVADCVNYMARRIISQGYCDANTDYRYFGANVGNKHQGFNVKYASDPYWGQKIAGHCYTMDRSLGNKDKNAYNIAVSTVADNVYYSPSTSSGVMYKLAMKSTSYPLGIPVIILDASNSTYYKIQSDMLIDEETGLTYWDVEEYSYNNVGYIKKSSVEIIIPASFIYIIDTENGIIQNITQKTSINTFLNNLVLPTGTTAKVFKSSTQVTSGYVGTNMVVKLYEGSTLKQTLTISVKGDLNADGVISISDLVMVKSHLLAKSTLSGIPKISGDMNGDGGVSISDFVMVKAVLLGK